MNEKVQWTPKKIRDAYGGILRAYNTLYPLDPVTRKDPEEIIERVGMDKEGTPKFWAKMREVVPKLKEAADQSGNAVSWYRGQSLDGLNQGMKDRVEKALKLGI